MAGTLALIEGGVDIVKGVVQKLEESDKADKAKADAAKSKTEASTVPSSDLVDAVKRAIDKGKDAVKDKVDDVKAKMRAAALQRLVVYGAIAYLLVRRL